MDIVFSLIQVFFTSVGSIIVLFLLTKLIGNKQVSQLNMFDYINGITIGSIAAEMATSLETDFLMPLLAMVIYGLTAFGLSYIAGKSVRARRLINGRSIILYDNGKLYFDNFKKSKLDINEFLIQCRIAGYFDLSQVQTVILEANGSVSVLPMSSDRPVTPADLGIEIKKETAPIAVIIDGEIQQLNLKQAGKDVKWLEKQLRANGVKNASEVFLATAGDDNTLTAYVRITGKKDTPENDIFL